ncbi:autotransporter domain-containing protein [Bosea sp. (in: a-proteobacteria)]|uniref:autotransporter domain-containing protein n=1 Tax=Bosea sp. (in: a-proteobacteria) TaxID=1871050 RepID=UPI0025BF7817|nr:autotransporter domain-containing protein [Bosea sp. (in: a-proteobacteria)]MBR3190358.1 autotransporter domain-containing protein [Bosea sp. (in: a-proteobacteria)]
MRLAARLRAGTALALLAMTLAGPVLANGGAGGAATGGGGGAGGNGGADNPTTPGDPGAAGTDTGLGANGGGGGGAGAGTGGAGGAGVSTIFGTSGSGGAGGAHGEVNAGLPAGSAAGSDGGNGGNGIYITGAPNVGGGGGGAGGYGAVVTGAGASGSLSGIVTGGRGGDGGAADTGSGSGGFGSGGSGGSGGTGLLFTGGGATLTVTGTVRGGDGGAAGASGPAGNAASAGAGGEGIVGSDLTIVTSGTVAGGMSGDGVQAAALHFTGGTNTITFLGTTTGLTGGIIADGPTLTFDQATNVTVDNVISGLGAVIKAGTGTLTLSGANTYAGGTFVEAGTLSISADANLGVASSGIAFTGGTLQVTGTFTTGRLLNLANTGTVDVTAGQILTVNGLVMGAGGLEKTGAGTLVLTNSNVYGGGTTISGGTVSVSSDANLGVSGTTVTLNNSTIVGGAGTGADAVLRTTASFSSSRNIDFSNGGGRIETATGTTLTLTGSLTTTGSASFIKQGAGTLVLTGDSSAGYNGRTWVNEGMLRIEGGGRLGSNSAGGQAYISNGATAIVTGAGSSWETFGQMRVGEHGSGMLRIEAGGSVRTGGGAGTVGIVGGGGDSSVTITGSGSQWVGNGTQVYIGHSNAGSLTLSDDGKFELTGASSVLQASLVGGSASGTVNIGAAEGSAAAAAGQLVVDTVALNTSASKLVFNHTNVGYAFSADITGLGSVRQLAGITVLTSNNNDYSGQTQVLGGRLVAGSSGAFSANSDYTVATGAVLEVAGGFGTVATVGSLSGAGFVRIGVDETLITGTTNQTATFSGTFLGDGSLEFEGSGTQIYTGTGTLGGGLSICACSTGSFIVRGGSLTLGMDIEVSGGTLVVDQGGKLDNGPAVFAVTSSAFATSTVRIDGAGTTVTTGSALVIGFVEKAEVTISGGASLVGDGGAAVMSAGDGTATAVVTGVGSRWSIGGGSLFVGSLDGTGQASVTVAEGGALAIAAGDLGIGAEGTLRISTGGRAGTVTLAAGAILNDGAIVTDFTDSATLAMAIDGTGTLTKRGSGTLNLTGTNTYTGATTVSGGKLVVNGSIANSVVTLTGGTLGGSGTVGGIVANTGATIAPGNSIGTLTVSGNVSFAGGSTYQVEVNAAGQSDRIVASGKATITGGTVQVLAENGNYAASTSYTILTATGGVTGQFSTVTSNLAFLTPSLAYDSQNVTLTMSRNDTSFGPDNGGGSTGGTSIAQTRNQGFIAVAAEALGVGNPVYDTLLSATAAEARAGFDLLSGEAHAQAVSVMIEESRLVRDTILSHLRGPLLTQAPGQVAGAFSADLPGRKGGITMPAPLPQPRYAVWGTAFGSTGNTDADGNAASLNRRSGGALLGADVMLYDAPGSSLKLGVAGGYSQSRFDLDARLSSGRLESGHAALYAGARFGNLRLDAGAAYSWSESDIRRQVAIRGFGDLLRLQRPGSVTQGFAELGYGFAFSGFALEPFAQLALIRVSTDAGTERGGAAALRVLSSEQTLGFSMLGLRAEAQLGAMPLFARAMLSWRHGFGELTPQARTAFLAGTTPATVFAARIDREAVVAEAGLDWRISQATALGLTYSAAIGERSRDHALKGRVEMRF